MLPPASLHILASLPGTHFSPKFTLQLNNSYLSFTSQLKLHLSGEAFSGSQTRSDVPVQSLIAPYLYLFFIFHQSLRIIHLPVIILLMSVIRLEAPGEQRLY